MWALFWFFANNNSSFSVNPLLPPHPRHFVMLTDVILCSENDIKWRGLAAHGTKSQQYTFCVQFGIVCIAQVWCVYKKISSFFVFSFLIHFGKPRSTCNQQSQITDPKPCLCLGDVYLYQVLFRHEKLPCLINSKTWDQLLKFQSSGCGCKVSHIFHLRSVKMD